MSLKQNRRRANPAQFASEPVRLRPIPIMLSIISNDKTFNSFMGFNKKS